MASSADVWRRRIVERLQTPPVDTDPRSALLANVIGAPSAELEALLAAPSREAAVLIGLVPRPDQLQILLTERAAHLPYHPGQISFPGGRLNPSENPVTAALREADEEVALASGQVEVLGLLPPRLTGTGFAVTPVVGWLAADFTPRPDPGEVESVFEVPVRHLLDPANSEIGTRDRYGTRFVAHEFRFRHHRIWGATAAILAEFLEVIDAKTI